MVVHLYLVAILSLAIALDGQGDVDLELVGSQHADRGRSQQREGHEDALHDVKIVREVMVTWRGAG